MRDEEEPSAMKFMTAAFTGIAACLLIASPASSDEKDYGRSGFYVGAGVIGASFVELDQIDNDVDPDEAAGFQLLAGYRASPILALEAEFEMLPESDVDFDGFGKIAELEVYTVTANMKMFMWTGRIQPFALVGLGAMYVADRDSRGLGGGGESESDFVFRFSGGLDFYITEKIVGYVGADYLLPAGGDLDDFDYVSYGAGLQYRF
jgi:opacity protein-like surface antigen